MSSIILKLPFWYVLITWWHTVLWTASIQLVAFSLPLNTPNACNQAAHIRQDQYLVATKAKYHYDVVLALEGKCFSRPFIPTATVHNFPILLRVFTNNCTFLACTIPTMTLDAFYEGSCRHITNKIFYYDLVSVSKACKTIFHEGLQLVDKIF